HPESRDDRVRGAEPALDEAVLEQADTGAPRAVLGARAGSDTLPAGDGTVQLGAVAEGTHRLGRESRERTVDGVRLPLASPGPVTPTRSLPAASTRCRGTRD